MLGKRIALGFGIAVFFPAMVQFGVSTFAPCPKRKGLSRSELLRTARKGEPRREEPEMKRTDSRNRRSRRN